jgi:DNA-binding NarL/FixJ family response regulator
MRVVIVGRASDRARLRADLRDAGLDVIGEAATLAAARPAFLDADAFVVASKPTPSSRRASALRTSEDDFDSDLDDGSFVEPLTPRELDVVRLLALGLPNKAIGARLGISDQTVKFHIASILGKLGAANRTEVVRRAARRGLIDL